MANERNPNDPYPSNLSDDDLDRTARYDTELQPDLELEEGPAGRGKVALFAVAVALVLGALFYGLNNSTTHQAGSPPPVQTAQQTQQTQQTPQTPQTEQTQPAWPAAPPGMRDVTPRAKADQGMTTGAASTRPQMPPATAPTQMNRPGNPATDNK
jgi:hypothetical protein